MSSTKWRAALVLADGAIPDPVSDYMTDTAWWSRVWMLVAAAEPDRALIGRFGPNRADRAGIAVSTVPRWLLDIPEWRRSHGPVFMAAGIVMSNSGWRKLESPTADVVEAVVPQPHVIVRAPLVKEWLTWATTLPEVVAAARKVDLTPLSWLWTVSSPAPLGGRLWPARYTGWQVGTAYGGTLAWYSPSRAGRTVEDDMVAYVWPPFVSEGIPRELGGVPVTVT